MSVSAKKERRGGRRVGGVLSRIGVMLGKRKRIRKAMRMMASASRVRCPAGGGRVKERSASSSALDTLWISSRERLP
jgi:hypothetical protein